MTSGVLIGPVQRTPTILCTGAGTGDGALWQKYGWGAQIMEASTAQSGFTGAVDNEGDPITIDMVLTKDEDALPWFLKPKLYYLLESTAYQTDLCEAPPPGKALAITMEGSPSSRKTVRSKTVELAETEAIMLFCPALFNAKTKLLSNVVGSNPEPYLGTQIEQVVAEVSLTVFHEFLHLVTQWVPGKEIVDITC